MQHPDRDITAYTGNRADGDSTNFYGNVYGDVHFPGKRGVGSLMAHEFPNGEFENWERCKQLLPHVERLYGVEPSANATAAKWAKVLTNAGWYLWTVSKQQKYHLLLLHLVK